MNSLFLARYQQIGILVVTLILLFLVVYVVLEYTRKNRTSPKAKENFRQRNLPTLEKGKVELYVGNLVYEMTDEQLYAEFAKFGVVDSAHVVSDRRSGRSKGYGFVTMSHREEAMIAIDKLNNFEYKGRRMRVNESRPNTRREI